MNKMTYSGVTAKGDTSGKDRVGVSMYFYVKFIFFYSEKSKELFVHCFDLNSRLRLCLFYSKINSLTAAHRLSSLVKQVVILKSNTWDVFYIKIKTSCSPIRCCNAATCCLIEPDTPQTPKKVAGTCFSTEPEISEA